MVCLWVNVIRLLLLSDSKYAWWLNAKSIKLSDGVVMNPPASAGDVGLIPESGRYSGEGKWQPTRVFLPEKFHRHRSLVHYSPWGHKESDTTEYLSTHAGSVSQKLGSLRSEIVASYSVF